MQSLGTVRSVLSVLAAGWVVACSFPDFGITPTRPGNALERICSDGASSEAETGVDCGGGCPPCPQGEPCRRPADCASGSCVAFTCQAPTCDDGVKNATEADTDCGGACSPCPPGRDCQLDADCAQGVCSATSCEEAACGDPFCQVPTCADSVKNGDETGADCGAACEPCSNGMGCEQDTDCVSGHCSDQLCVAPGCTDELANGRETDLDCGGPDCKPCGPGGSCAVGTDCSSGVCQDELCSTDGCDDGVQNLDESDIDCGGSTCDGCGELARCAVGEDCASGVCLTNLCVPAAPTGTALSRVGWHASAPESYPDHRPDQVLDSTGGRWTTGVDQHSGMYFEIDMAKPQAFFSIVFTCTEAPNDAPGEYRIFLATEKGKYGSPAGPNKFGSTVSSYSFDTARIARYIKIELLQSKEFWWSINEVNVLK